MKNLLVLTLSLLMVLVNAAPVYGQSLAGDCRDTQAIPLVHGQPVVLEYRAGQNVTLAGDAGGKADLQGQSVVAIEFSPVDKGVGYGVEAWPAQTVTDMLAEGSNTIRLIAVNPEDRAWLIVETPCLSVALAPTATDVPVPSPTPLMTAMVQSPTGTMTVAEDSAIIGGADISSAGTAWMQRTGRMLLAAALLGLLLLFATHDRQSWQVSLRRLEVLKPPALRLLAWWRTLEAYLLNWWKRQT